MPIGRNDPCHCGSGRKYKHCHLAAEAAAEASVSHGVPSPFHDVDRRLRAEIVAYVATKYGAEMRDAYDTLSTHPQMTRDFIESWLAWVESVDGRPTFECFSESREWSLPASSREWIDAQRKSWFGIWTIAAVDRGRSLTLVDRLTRERREIHDVLACENALLDHDLLARVVDVRSVSLISTIHPIPLRPLDGSAVAESVRRKLRRRSLSPDKLRDSAIAWKMLQEWSNAVTRLTRPPALQNTDGDPILLTTDRWTFAAAHRDAIVEALSTLEGAQRSGPGEVPGQTIIHFIRPDDPADLEGELTVVGMATITAASLTAETNSIARADALAARIEEAAGRRLQREPRSHSDPTSDAVRSAPANEPALEPTAEEIERIGARKSEYMDRWLDLPIPFLGNVTPREAAKTRRGREQLEDLFRQLSIHERQLPAAEQFDVESLRRKLGM